ncbi:MAG: hypothetical protein R3C26_18755 [Calditrichia bacterium]
MIGDDPLYNNPTENDYRLGATSPARLAADDGRAMGDLRWEVLPSQVYLNIQTVGNGQLRSIRPAVFALPAPW